MRCCFILLAALSKEAVKNHNVIVGKFIIGTVPHFGFSSFGIGFLAWIQSARSWDINQTSWTWT